MQRILLLIKMECTGQDLPPSEKKCGSGQHMKWWIQSMLVCDAWKKGSKWAESFKAQINADTISSVWEANAGSSNAFLNWTQS